MRRVELLVRGESARYHVGWDLKARIPSLLKPLLDGRRCFVISDETVGPLHGREIASRLNAPILELPAGEEHKRWSSVDRVAEWVVSHEIERADVLVAVGGGVITDLVGFAASITLRGLQWVAVPTTLLAMVDAAIGGKTGIDMAAGKNLLGTFWAPSALVADPGVLATLDGRQLRAGLGEVVKAAMVAPTSLEPLLDMHLAELARGELGAAEELIASAARIKAEIVAHDEREKGPRAALNLGHTLGHALEAATDYRRLLHGEAVAWGLLAALLIARNRGLQGTADAQSWAARIERLAPLPAIDDLSWERLRPFIRRDKKRRGGRVEWVLPRLGGVALGVDVGDDEVVAALEALATASPGGSFAAIF